MRPTGSKPSLSGEWPPRSSLEEIESSEVRLEEEREAKKRNDEIDRLIELERQELKKRRPQAKLLLLGQAEAGKSTLLKNFQLLFAPKAFQAETEAWRAVIHLNLVRAVNFILEVFSTPYSTESHSNLNNRSQSSLSNHSARHVLSDPVRTLRMRLSPLRQVEIILHGRIAPESQPHSPVPGSSNSSSDDFNSDLRSSLDVRLFDTSLRARAGWKALARLKRPTSTTQDELQDARQVLDACRDDIIALWTNAIVQEELRKRAIILDDSYIYFLDNAVRIASTRYSPNPEDILRARVQTIGVEEHHLVMEDEIHPGHEWIFYDVEGRRGQRAVWASFFDDVNAMIFLSPISNFDVFLPEDPSVNSMLDSFSLWKQICESKLLTQATFILFLNKMDLLQKKLDAGIQFSAYVPLYKNQPNDLEGVTLYCKRKFHAVHKHSSPQPRPLHIHTCTAIDTAFMGGLLARVKDAIFLTMLRENGALV
ncbi:guanine nucleotide binding protein, alpha subunit [Irpex rosettiformis]|uniref:Guanine nucleotide binding protein, alpha subunit n=1 Tax=Irpex rosettiformis TaxID=378272 RepID=A0ACB8UHJ5_9APHY|nr:guanine nucleotide binding protein, alpha subunit [Irpex rosettiformis]